MGDLAPVTRGNYTYFLFGILTHRFGHMMPHEVNDGHIAMFLEDRKKEHAAVAGNRARATLSAVFEFAMRNGLAKHNPCRGVARNRERPSTIYVETSALTDTVERAPDKFALILQFAYLTGMRTVDIRALQLKDLTLTGIWYTESKTGHRVEMAWTPDLVELLHRQMALRRELMTRQVSKPSRRRALPEHEFVFVQKGGRPLGTRMITMQMRRLAPGFRFRDLRPKAQTDAGERNVLGHTGQMRALYTRRKKLVPVH